MTFDVPPPALIARLEAEVRARIHARLKPLISADGGPTPAMVKAELVKLVDEWRAQGMLTAAELDVKVERDPNDPTRLLITLPPAPRSGVRTEKRQRYGPGPNGTGRHYR